MDNLTLRDMISSEIPSNIFNDNSIIIVISTANGCTPFVLHQNGIAISYDADGIAVCKIRLLVECCP